MLLAVIRSAERRTSYMGYSVISKSAGRRGGRPGTNHGVGHGSRKHIGGGEPDASPVDIGELGDRPGFANSIFGGRQNTPPLIVTTATHRPIITCLWFFVCWIKDIGG
jgi:hypothetical protein